MDNLYHFYTDPEDATSILWTIIPDDGSSGYVVGDMQEVVQLRDALNALILDGIDSGQIERLDERLGYKWLTSGEARALATQVAGVDISKSTLTRACRVGHIRLAQKSGRDWKFPQQAFLHWLDNRPKPGPKTRKDTE